MAGADLPFTKMHGCGNDYVVVDAAASSIADPSTLARALTARRFGVGADGLLLALPSDVADLRMRMFNADGSEAEMCGNGLRCLVKFAYERRLLPRRLRGRIETGAGILGYALPEGTEADGPVDEVELDMGRPGVQRSDVGMVGPDGRVLDEPLALDDRVLLITAVSMGNPHAVTWVEDAAAYPVEAVGRQVETHAAFPRRTNSEFVETISPREVRQRTWERGCGETLACGTGACAVVVAGVLTGRLEREVLLHLSGGDLRVRWDEADDHVYLGGPAVEVYEGRWPGER